MKKEWQEYYLQEHEDHREMDFTKSAEDHRTVLRPWRRADVVAGVLRGRRDGSY